MDHRKCFPQKAQSFALWTIAGFSALVYNYLVAFFAKRVTLVLPLAER